jgi:hypothetical protein
MEDAALLTLEMFKKQEFILAIGVRCNNATLAFGGEISDRSSI